MFCVKRLLNPSLIFAIALVAQASSSTKAQTPETKPRATASITGRITIGEKPAPGVVVAATTLTYPQMLVAQTLSDTDGKYRLSGLMPGQINVSAVAPTFVLPGPSLSYQQGRVLNLSADEAVEGIDFKLTRGSVITGKVTDVEGKPVIDRLALILVDEKGEPLRNQPTIRSANPSVLSTDDRGIYRIYGLPAGRYKISAGDNGGGATLRASFYQKTYYPDTTEIAKAAIVELGEGTEAKNIDITLGPRSRTYSVTGKVIDGDTGEPVVGIDYAFGTVAQYQSQLMLNGYSSTSSPTNSKGEFRLDGVAPGKYAVMTLRSNFGLDQNQPKIYSDPVPFEVIDSDVSDVEIKTHRGLTVSGTVVTDGITNKAALAGVSRLVVSSFTATPPGTIQTFGNNTSSSIAPDGSFQLEGLRPGKVSLNVGGFGLESRGYTTLRVTAGDRELPNRQLDLGQENVSGVRIYIQYGNGVLKGEVKITGGTLAPEIALIVFLQRENQPGRVASAAVDARGHFVMSGIAAGNYEAVLQVSAAATANPNDLPRQQRQSVTVADDSESQISFTVDLTKKDGP